jgi:hypothetical protein
MADSNFRGPIASMGSLEDVNAASTGTAVASISPTDGPSAFYQGSGFPDPRTTPFVKDFQRQGQVPLFLQVGDCYTLDAIPQAQNTTLIAAAQVITASVAMSLSTIAVTNFSSGACSIAYGVPILPQGATAVVTAPIALDFGFATGTTIANSTAVQVSNTALFQQGQWIIIGNVANAAGTASLLTQVVTTINATTIGVSPTPATALGAPIGAANLFGANYLPPGTQFGPATTTASYHRTSQLAGFYRVHNPNELLARSIAVAAATITSGTATLLISGWDVWGQAMTQLVTASGTTPVYTPKAFKYINTIVPQTLGTTVTPNYNVGIGDNFGFPLFMDNWAHVQVYAGNTAISNNVGFSTGVTGAATNTTGDVRGTVLLSGNGTGTPISAPATTNNVLRLVVIQNLSQNTILQTTPNNLAPMFGTTQV